MNIRETTDRYIFNTYKRYPIVLKRAKGSWVWDEKGKKYLDFFSGLAVSGVAHNLPQVVAAIRAQSAKLIHSSNLYYTEPGAKLAETLCKRSFAGKVFFANSGAEANECAIKLARRFGDPTGRYEMIVFENSFHGRTMGALAATAQPKFHQGFGPMLPGFVVAKFNDLESVERKVTDKTAAILIEPIQGEGGVRPATREFLQGLRALATRRNLLLIFDGIQCSLGRTGDLFSYQTYGVEPDVLTLAKGLGGGLPIAATLAHERFATLLGLGDHGTTFGANPLCSAAALAVLKTLTPALFKNVRRQSEILLKELRALASEHSFVREIRGHGLMLGMELSIPGAPIVESCWKAGLLINCTQTTTLRFLPPLALSDSEREFALRILRSVFRLVR
jgi:acetylornithine/N-succinyldiaminopimelate aminotransferase